MRVSHRKINRLSGLAIAGLALLASGQAAAEPRHVAVLSVSGAGNQRVRAYLESYLQENHKLVVREAVTEAARELGIQQRLTVPANLSRIARRAQVDAVITAYVYRAKRQWWLAVRVHDGGTGRLVRGGAVMFAYFALNKWNKAAIDKILAEGLSKAQGVPHTPAPRVVEPEVKEPEPEVKEPGSTKAPPRPRWLSGIHGGAGVAMLGRRLSLKNLEGQPGSQVLYETNSPVVPISFFVEAYPGAFVTQHRVLANIGLGFSFQRAVGVVSYRESDRVEIATTIQRVGGHLSFRWNVKQSATSPELKLNLGVEALEFSFARNLEEVPGVLYLSFKPELRARFFLGTERVSLGLQLAALAVASMGQMTDAYHYGLGKGAGVETGLELDVRLYWRLHLLVGFTTSWLFIRFPQRGEQGIDYEYSADSARDGYYGGYLLLSVRY